MVLISGVVAFSYWGCRFRNERLVLSIEELVLRSECMALRTGGDVFRCGFIVFRCEVGVLRSGGVRGFIV